MDSTYLEERDISGEIHGRIDSVANYTMGVVMPVRGVSKPIILTVNQMDALRRDFAPDDMDMHRWVGRSVKLSRDAYGINVQGLPAAAVAAAGIYPGGRENVRVSRHPGVGA